MSQVNENVLQISPKSESVAKPVKTKSPRRRPATKIEPKVEAKVEVKPDNTKAVATFGVVFMSVLSAALNGFANAQHAPTPSLGWLMGISVPIIVLVLGKVAGNKAKKGQFQIAYAAAGSGLALLILSVWHCAESISILTGSGLFLAIPLAVGIDCGLVACEIAIVTEE